MLILQLIQQMDNEEQRDLASRIYEEQMPRMKKIAYWYLKNYHDAEDAAMNAMHTICLNIDKFETYDKVQNDGLITAYIRSAALDMYRKNGRKSETFEAMDIYDGENTVDESADLEHNLLHEEKLKHMWNAIAELGDSYNDVMMMKYFHGMEYEEIAEQLNLNVSTVTWRVCYAKKKVSKRMKELGYVIK